MQLHILLPDSGVTFTLLLSCMVAQCVFVAATPLTIGAASFLMCSASSSDKKLW